MKKLILSGIAAMLAFAGSYAWALEKKADMKEANVEKPVVEKPAVYGLYEKLVGDWEYEAEITMEPGKDPIKTKGTDSTKTIGEFWIVTEVKGEMMDTPFTGIMSLGYDQNKKKPVGTWIDSMNSHLLMYEGELNDAGDTISLFTECACPMQEGKMMKCKDVISCKGKDEKFLESYAQDEKGAWVCFMKIKSTRKK